MILIIDGYNVLKQVRPSKKISDDERALFIRALDIYGRKKRLDIIVAFDGGPYGSSAREREGDVLVFYSGARQSADALIIEQVAKFKGQDVLVVSSDRSVRQQALALGVKSISALDFYEIFDQRVSVKKQEKGGAPVKMTQSENNELDELMKQTTTRGVSKIEDAVNRRNTLAQTLSKEQKKLLKKIRKL